MACDAKPTGLPPFAPHSPDWHLPRGEARILHHVVLSNERGKENEMRVSARSQLTLILGSLLVVAALAVPLAAHSDDGYATDGYLSWDDNSDCLLMRDHDGKTRVLTGAIDGLDEEDHVRLWGHTVRSAECNGHRGPAYEVTEVLTLWANDRHTETFYDHETDGSFRSWVRHNRDD
jgi:hypothetical protein